LNSNEAALVADCTEHSRAIEYEIGGAIGAALHEKYGKRQPVNAQDRDVTVITEVLERTRRLEF